MMPQLQLSRPGMNQPPLANQRYLPNDQIQVDSLILPTSRFSSLLVLVLFVVLALFLSACSPRATGGNTIELAEDYSAAVDLPALVIDYSVQGAPSVGGLPLSEFLAQLGFDPSIADLFYVDPTLITQLNKSNIQHIQFDNSINGVIILVNGEPVPSLVWDKESLVAVADVMDIFGYGIEDLESVLPLLQTMGIGAILRFPIAEDAVLIPTVVDEEESVAHSMAVRQKELQETIGNAAQVQIIVNYAEDGSWTVAGMDATQWSQILPAPWEDLNLRPDMVAQLQERGIQQIGFASNPDGLFISVNDTTLPYLAWGRGELQHLLSLVLEPSMLAYLTGVSSNNIEEAAPLINRWLPIIQMANTRLTIIFP